METVVLDENILELFDLAADGGYADAISSGDVGLGAILAPIHQRHQQSIFQTLGWRPAKIAQTGSQHVGHHRKNVRRSARKAFEHFRFRVL